MNSSRNLGRAWAYWRGCALALLALLCAPAVRADTATHAALANSQTWRRLLHVPNGAQRSEVQSADFFLAAMSPGEPLAELQALLAAYRQPWGADPSEHVRCRFPARLFFVAQHIDLPGYSPREPRCAALEHWAKFDELRSASLLLVSGYFGNPASTFGHALLRLNTGEPSGSQTLLDLGFNFGALIPPNESTPVYIYKGLTGGYVAGFSDKYFYSHDLVYSGAELRDMWDYELALNSDQLMLLAMHLYELSGRKFTYYFLSENCAYRLAELVQLASGYALTDNARIWYAPVELFHRLHDADALSGGALIRAVRFVPSSESQLRAAMGALSADERAVARRAMAAAAHQLATALAELPPTRSAPVIEALLSHAQMKHVAELPNVVAATRERQAWLLRQRLLLPPTEQAPPAPPPRPSPAGADRPSSFGAGLTNGVGRRPGGLMMRAAAFDYNALGDQGLDGGELVVLDALAVLTPGSALRLEQLDAIRVSKIDTTSADLGLDGALSWQTRVGARRFGHLQGDAMRTHLAFGAGRAWRAADTSVVVMLDAELLAKPGTLALQPRLGLATGPGRWRASLQTAWRRESGVKGARTISSAAAHWRFMPGFELRVFAARDPLARAGVTINTFR